MNIYTTECCEHVLGNGYQWVAGILRRRMGTIVYGCHAKSRTAIGKQAPIRENSEKRLVIGGNRATR